MNSDYTYWKEFRIFLTNLLKQEDIKLEKNKENIYKMYVSSGLKSTARYFNIETSQVMYYVKKYKEDNNIL